MKILHINVNYKTNILHSFMIKHLKNAGVEGDVFVPVAYNDNYSCDDENVTVSRCFNKFDRFNFFGKQKKIYSALTQKYNINDYQCVHAYTVFTDGNIAYRLNKKYSIPYVVAVRNTDINTFFKYMPHLRKRGVEILKNASAVFFLSESYMKRTFEKYIPRNLKEEIRGKSYLIPNGIDDFWLERKAEKAKKEDSVINVAAAGVIDKNKNMLSVARALDLLKNRGYEVSFNIAGRVGNKKIFDNLSSYSFVNYYGKLNREELCNMYKKNDVFALASFHETFGMVYIEAMSCGLPVIYTENEGFDGQFENGCVGFSVKPEKIEDIAEKILKVYENRETISKNCVALVDRFNWKGIAKKYKEIYCNIIG